jgi:hypothetical protein
VETLLLQSKILKLIAKMTFKSKFERLLAQTQRRMYVISEKSSSDEKGQVGGWNVVNS